MSYPRIEVKWLDSCHHQGWHEISETKNYHPAHCRSTGYLIRNDDKEILMAMNLQSTNAGDFMSIPKCAIKEMKELK